MGDILFRIGAVIVWAVVIHAVLILQRYLKYPEAGLFLAFLNVIMNPLRWFKIGPFNVGKNVNVTTAMKDAMTATKLNDFGDLSFVDAYHKVFNGSFHHKLILSNIGHIVSRKEFAMIMSRKLKVNQFLKNNPQVHQVPCKSPVFVFGLGRTGTTFLHRLLSLDPKVRSPALWELINPVPRVPITATREEMEKDRKKRGKFMDDLIKQREWMGDKTLEHIHEIGAYLPEECLMALSNDLPITFNYLSSFLLTPELTFHPNEDLERRGFRTYKTFLQMLTYQMKEEGDPKTWVLKCPIHCLYIRQIAEVFPDAKLVWAHRHPANTVSSLSSLLRALLKVYYEDDNIDNADVGKKVANLARYVLEKAPKDIADTKLPCANVIYSDLIENPLKVIREIYAEFGWTVSPEYEKIIASYLEENKQKRERIKSKKAAEGKSAEVLHEHKPEDFGLTSDELTSGVFKTYMEKYGVTVSK